MSLEDRSFEPTLPHYSPQPSQGEERLWLNSPHPSPVHTGTFSKQGSNGTSIVLKGQNNQAVRPSFERGAAIRGVVNVGSVEGLKSVQIELHGVLEITASSLGTEREDLLRQSQVLWTDTTDIPSPSGTPGGRTFDISIVLPTSSLTDGELPPSLSFEDFTMSVKVQYSLCVAITRHRKRKINLRPSSAEKTTVDFDYVPRSRSPRSLNLGLDLGVLTSVKTEPEEWLQSYTTFSTARKPKTGSARSTINCDFFTPAAKIFSVTDTLPFHIQLTGQSEVLADFLPPSYQMQDLPLKKSKLKLKQQSSTEPIIQVQILRQLVAMCGKQKLVSSIILGEAQIWQLPSPSESSLPNSNDGEDLIVLQWEGKVKCDHSGSSNMRMCNFNTGNLTAKDFILLTVLPNESRFEAMKLPVPIGLVTDSH